MNRRGARIALLLLIVLGVTSVTPPASAQRRLLDRTGDRASFSVAGGGRLLINARARPCRGFATMRVVVDGRVDRSVRLTHRGAWTYRTARSYARRPHVVTIVMRGDRRIGRGACDRNIRVLRVRAARPGLARASARPGRHFTLAVIGDTQAEVLGHRSSFGTRTSWLAAHKGALDLRFVGQTGDLTNWGWLDARQFQVATAAMSRLTAAGIPWQVAVGNHDTAAVGWNGVKGSRTYGGAAYAYNPECPERLTAARCRTKLLVRDTNAFNDRVPAPAGQDVAGRFEGKLDNSYSRFSAAGRTWLVLNVELWPRQAALDWASRVLTSHPRDNAIILTHDYLRADGSINPYSQYGSLAATEIYRQLVARHRNVKLVFSGHEGLTARRVDLPGGNKVVSYLGNETRFVGVTRLVDIDADNGVVRTRWWSGTVNLSGKPTGTTADAGFSFR